MKEKIYNFIVEFMTSNGYSPSVREICSAVGLSSVSTAHAYLQVLLDEGRITMKNNTARTISLVGYKLVKLD